MTSYSVTWITESLAVGHAPMSPADLAAMKVHGIDGIVNLCGEFSDLHRIEADAGFEVCYLPVRDEDVPGMEALEEALSWLDEAVYLGKKVLVHCRFGIGRTGTFVTSYLMRRGLGLSAATKKLKVSGAVPSSYDQWKLLKIYGKKTGVLTLREPSLGMGSSVDLGPFFSDYEALLTAVDREVREREVMSAPPGGKERRGRCTGGFDLQLIEGVYLHTLLNRRLTSLGRELLIKRAAEGGQKGGPSCPLKEADGCLAYDLRPVRCRVYGGSCYSEDKLEVRHHLFELSQSLFLAFSGCFLPDGDFTFSVGDAVSGRFVQKYFDCLARIKKGGRVFPP